MRSHFLLLMGVMGLGACHRPSALAGGSEAHGRYAGAGVYPAGRMWAQMSGATAPKDAASARIGDDEQVIVVVDSRTGELRQIRGAGRRRPPERAGPRERRGN